MKKLCSYKVSNTFVASVNMVAPWGNLGEHGGTILSRKNLNCVPSRSNHVPSMINCVENFV
jgi:hypothetical protein